MTEKEWDEKWEEKLRTLPTKLESIEQVNMVMQSTIDRYRLRNMDNDVLLWTNVLVQMNRLWNLPCKNCLR